MDESAKAKRATNKSAGVESGKQLSSSSRSLDLDLALSIMADGKGSIFGESVRKKPVIKKSAGDDSSEKHKKMTKMADDASSSFDLGLALSIMADGKGSFGESAKKKRKKSAGGDSHKTRKMADDASGSLDLGFGLSSRAILEKLGRRLGGGVVNSAVIFDEDLDLWVTDELLLSSAWTSMPKAVVFSAQSSEDDTCSIQSHKR